VQLQTPLQKKVIGIKTPELQMQEAKNITPFLQYPVTKLDFSNQWLLAQEHLRFFRETFKTKQDSKFSLKAL